MIKRSFFGFIFCCLLMSAAAPAQAQDVQVTASFDRQSANVQQEINLKIRIIGASGNVQAPRLPGFKGFDTYYTGRVSNISFINGRSSSTIEFSYILVPKVAGKFTLSPIQVQVGDRVYATQPITVEIFQGQQPAQQTAQPAQPSPYQTVGNRSTVSNPSTAAPAVQPPTVAQGGQDSKIFVQAWLDRSEVYPNEQVLLSYSIYTSYDTRYDGFEEEPSISGFWIEEFPPEKEMPREMVRLNGRQYIKADIRKIALFPTAAADYDINPGTVLVSIRQQPTQTGIFDDFFDDSFFSGGSFFARRENRLLKPEPIKLKVKPFPEAGKPASFNGAVGSYKMTASINKKQVKQNEPITMTLILEGTGNIETLNKPVLPELDEFKIYESDTSTQLFKNGLLIGGKKTFEIVFIPREAGALNIPSLEFSYFDPRQERYFVQKTPVFQLSVEESEDTFQLPDELSQQDIFKKGVKVEGRDINYIMVRLPGDTVRVVLDNAYYALLVLNAILFLWLLFSFYHLHKIKIYAKDDALRRRRQAKSVAMSGVKNLKTLKRKEADGFFEEADKVLTQYLADKFNLSAYGGTRREIERELEKRLGFEDALYKDILAMYDVCDHSRFAGGKGQAKSEEKIINVIQRTIQKMEKICR